MDWELWISFWSYKLFFFGSSVSVGFAEFRCLGVEDGRLFSRPVELGSRIWPRASGTNLRWTVGLIGL